MQLLHLDPDSIIINEDRQRKDLGDIPGLAESIKARGQIQPIVVRPEGSSWVLVAGERRLRACASINFPVLARSWDDLSPREAELIELEENTKRKDLHWTELAEAIQRIHRLKLEDTPTWTLGDTAEFMGYERTSQNAITKALALEGHLDDSLRKAPTMESAYNTISRKQNRAFQDLANDILTSKVEPKPGTPASAPAPAPAPSPGPVLCESFLSWAPSYSGPKFNFLHCDFPYGIDLGESDQMRHDTETLYEDSPEIYWELLRVFCASLDNFTYPSAHLMFWFSMEYYHETRTYIESNTDFRLLSRPLVWHKSDNSGVMPDHRRRPRNTYEVAFMGARQDRFIIEPVSSSYAGPTASKKLHPSEKPEPMLKHFFRMFVNEETAILDPTCGGGSALRAADELSAKRVLGLELDSEFASAANGAFRVAAIKREGSKRVTSNA